MAETRTVEDSGLADALRRLVPGARVDARPAVDMPTVVVDREHLLAACRALRDDSALQFAFLADVTAVDRHPAEPRFEVVYHLACLGPAYAAATGPAPARRLRLKVALPADDARVPSVVSIWPTANWPEREVFDLFGIAFDAHPDLRRVLMPDDWDGHPLRKDYPVQVRRNTASWSPLQVSVEEFAETMRRRAEQSAKDAQGGRHDA